MNSIIRKDGANLIIEVTAIDNNGNGIVAGLVVTASIQRMSDGLYWSLTPAFDSVPEGALHTLIHQNNGLYAFTLIGGAEAVYRGYRVHLVITGNPQVNTNATFSAALKEAAAAGAPVTLDNSPANKLVVSQGTWDSLRSAHNVAGSFGENVRADLIKWAGSTTIDTVSIEDFGEAHLAYIQGRFKINYPLAGDITFYKRDNVTELFTMHVTPTERTRL